jgi:hypothetical protein
VHQVLPNRYVLPPPLLLMRVPEVPQEAAEVAEVAIAARGLLKWTKK